MFVNGLPSVDISSAFSASNVTSRQQQESIGRELEQALRSGDLSSAQKAFEQLSASGAESTGFISDPTLRADFEAVGQDLKNGNLSAAQSDMQTFNTQLIHNDMSTAIRNYKAGDTQGFQQAVANLKNDYWAAYGVRPSDSDLRAMLDGNASFQNGLNLQA